ncbi:cytochrome c [Rhodospirillaceae bacterium KN72]|uniref:Cytochrome c n=1 Tax=Pacificispira spongiicola TaxID=2729598 RepID=A0A7Y0DYF5_9PROT|nr:cytochrome c [Pacificispira spongiicola]NMM43904.1 cytochrome c [Pacificispira spongiicola]
MKDAKKKFGLKSIVTIVAIASVAGGAYLWRQSADKPSEAGATLVIPEFSEVAFAGEQSFNNTCAKCHGMNAIGTKSGPPLIHNIYNPGHHSDEAFYRAVAMGARQHHWRFGDMPAQQHVSPQEVARIVAYIRELQSANGIRYEKHTM